MSSTFLKNTRLQGATTAFFNGNTCGHLRPFAFLSQPLSNCGRPCQAPKALPAQGARFKPKKPMRTFGQPSAFGSKDRAWKGQMRLITGKTGSKQDWGAIDMIPKRFWHDSGADITTKEGRKFHMNNCRFCIGYALGRKDERGEQPPAPRASPNPKQKGKWIRVRTSRGWLTFQIGAFRIKKRKP